MGYPARHLQKDPRWDQYVEDVKRVATGRWLDVASAFCSAQLGPAISKMGRHVHCPIHGGKNGDAFRLRNDFQVCGASVCNTCGKFSSGFDTLMWLLNQSFGRTVRDVGDYLCVPYYGEPSTAIARIVRPRPELVHVGPSPEEVAREDDKKAGKMKRAWDASLPLNDERSAPVRAYLKNRGFSSAAGPLSDIRFHPGMKYWAVNPTTGQLECIGTFPVMLALVREPSGRPMTLHRTYLTTDGRKADVEEARKMMSQRSTAVFHGSAIRLDMDVGCVLCAGEGIESSLAFREVMGIPTWATGTAGLLETLSVPESVKIVIAAGDRDRPVPGYEMGRGQAAAAALCSRIKQEGLAASAFLPPFAINEGASSVDWADVVGTYGLDGAKRLEFVQAFRSQLADQVERMGMTWEDVRAHY